MSEFICPHHDGCDHNHGVLTSSPTPEPPLDVARLAQVFSVSPIAWPVRRANGALVMTLMLDSPEEAAEHVAAEYARLSEEELP